MVFQLHHIEVITWSVCPYIPYMHQVCHSWSIVIIGFVCLCICQSYRNLTTLVRLVLFILIIYGYVRSQSAILKVEMLHSMRSMICSTYGGAWNICRTDFSMYVCTL